MKELSGERIKEILHILRNPWGKADEEMMKARHDAADYIESGLTQRTPDLWDSAPRQSFSTLKANLSAEHLSTPPTSG
jgi:hypothetical protein